MITELLGHKDYLRILLLLRKHKGLRFSEIKKELGLNPNQVSRALEVLEEGLWVIPRAIPKGDRILAQYELSKRAECFLNDVVDPMRDAVRKNVAAFGSSELREVQALYR
jgi:DNA-binding IclR family transcriptional regulator